MDTPQDNYYTRLLDNPVKINNSNGEPLSNEKLQQTVSDVREKTDAEHERNINKITCDTSFQSPIQKKDVSTINDSVYYDLDEHADTISDSNKHVDPRNYLESETHIVNRIRKLSFRLLKPAVFRVIGKGLIKNVLENSHVEISLNSLSPLNTNTSKAIVTDSACKSAEVDRNTLKSFTLPDRTIWYHNRNA